MTAPSLALEPPSLGPDREACPDLPGPVLPDSNADLQAALLPAAARQVGRIESSNRKILDNLMEAADSLVQALTRPSAADAAPPDLFDVSAEWVAGKLGELILSGVDALSKRVSGIQVGEVLSAAQAIHGGLQRGRAAAHRAQQAIDVHDRFLGLKARFAHLQSVMTHSAQAWAVQAQAQWESAPPAAQEELIARLRGLADELQLREYTAGSLPAVMAAMVGEWARGRGGRADLLLRGEDMADRELRLDAPFSAQLGGALAAADADLRDLGADLHVTWLPLPGMPLLAVKAVVPAGGDPAVTYSSNGIDPRYRARLLAFLRDPCSYVSYAGE